MPVIGFTVVGRVTRAVGIRLANIVTEIRLRSARARPILFSVTLGRA